MRSHPSRDRSGPFRTARAGCAWNIAVSQQNAVLQACCSVQFANAIAYCNSIRLDEELSARVSHLDELCSLVLCSRIATGGELKLWEESAHVEVQRSRVSGVRSVFVGGLRFRFFKRRGGRRKWWSKFGGRKLGRSERGSRRVRWLVWLVWHQCGQGRRQLRCRRVNGRC